MMTISLRKAASVQSALRGTDPLQSAKTSSKGRLRTGHFCLETHQIPQSFESSAILLTWYRDTAASVYLRLLGAWRHGDSTEHQVLELPASAMGRQGQPV